MDLNKAMIIGNVTRDPETRTTPAGQTVCNFAVATNLVWKDQSGQKQEKAEFHNVVAWRKLAETIAQYVKKGSRIYIEGRIQTRSWDDQATNTKRYRTEIICDNMIMLDRAGANAGQGQNRSYQSPAANQNEQPTPADDFSQSSAPAQGRVSADDEINVEDIPF
ncbi:MAG: single-stranded DNA-binding protein [Candidatus Komeilibacteria bacterium]|nr:single-stranded DNA-binding protein [Candidatus Komeilibacteria bacterium]